MNEVRNPDKVFKTVKKGTTLEVKVGL